MTLDVAEALRCISRLRREALPALATDLLASGVDTPSLRRLAGLVDSELDEAADCFGRALGELGRPELTKPEAASRLAVDLAESVLSSRVSKRSAASIGAEYARVFDYERRFMALYAADDEYDCPCHGPTVADADVVQWATETLGPTSRHAV